MINCNCGDPSCGYCLAALGDPSHNLYSFENFLVSDADDFGGVESSDALETIFEEAEDEAVEEVEAVPRDTEPHSENKFTELKVTQMSESPTGSSFSRLFGDYDPPSNERTSGPLSGTSPLSQKQTSPLLFSPSLLSHLQLSASSNGSDDSEEEYLGFQLLPYSHDFETASGEKALGGGKAFGFDGQMISEDEKKRLKNTEAARRCREKIKKRTEELEEELSVHTRRNNAMNIQRQNILAQIKEQGRMLSLLSKGDPNVKSDIFQEVTSIADYYNQQVNSKRDQISQFFATTCHRSY